MRVAREINDLGLALDLAGLITCALIAVHDFCVEEFEMCI